MTIDQNGHVQTDEDVLSKGYLNQNMGDGDLDYALEGVENGDNKLEADWTTQAESNQFGPWVEYMRDSSTASLAGFMSFVRASKLNEDQRKLSLKKEAAGNIQMRAACNNRVGHLRALSRQTKILTEFKETDALPDPLKPSALGLDEAQIAIVMELESVKAIYGDDRKDITDRIVDLRLNQINKQRRKISRSISRDIDRGVFHDNGRLNALMEQSERRPLVGGEVAQALALMPDQHRENYMMGMSTQSDTELQHLQTIIIKQPVNAVTNAAKNLMNNARRGRRGSRQPRSREFMQNGGGGY